MKHIIFFLIDGLADPKAKNTPLRLAKKENINRLLPSSFLGKFYPLQKDEWPKSGYASVSQYANLGILGYKTKRLYAKRGPIEAVGSDLEYKDGWLAIRFDFASVDEKLILVDRRAGRETWGLDQLTAELRKLKIENLKIEINRTYGHRGVLIFKSKQWSDQISNSDPLQPNKKVLTIKPLTQELAALKTAKMLQGFLSAAHRRLKNHPINQARTKRKLLPANYLLTREAGDKVPRLQNFFDLNKKYFLRLPRSSRQGGILRGQSAFLNNGLVIAENGVIKGTCKLAGFETLTIPELNEATNYESLTNIRKTATLAETAKIKNQFDVIFDQVLKNSKRYNLLYVHIKEADEAAHDQDCTRKKQVLELFDQYFGSLTSKLGLNDYTYIITGDHITNCQSGQHQYGPVPVLFINKKMKSNQPKEFSEIGAKTKIKNIWKSLQM